MPRRFLPLFAVLAFAAAVILAIARPGAPLSGGASITKMAAVADAQPSATPWAYIDKVENGDGWCDPNHIDTTTTEYVGDFHQFALCVGNLTEPVYSFQATISYDGALDECIDEECQPLTFGAQTIQLDEGCVDDNPDANAGATFWGDGLGAGWDCFYYFADGYSLVPALGQDPTCDMPDHSSSQRTAEIDCHGTNSYTLGDDETWGALAVINMNVIAAGTDNVDIESLQVRIDDEVPIISCGYVLAGADVNADSVIEEPCQGATDIKKPPERHRRPTDTPIPTPTSTPTPEVPTVPPPPPPTATPFGGAGPAIVAPTTGSGPTGSGAPWALWLAAGLAGVALAAGGFHIRQVKSDH
jgi:hypothetical protein